uniref:CCR4-NOT transcription complex subunit 11 n=1 Tax=Steinernema glaseri TaxID=37863 RepID=A0A1I8A8Y0_9BILA
MELISFLHVDRFTGAEQQTKTIRKGAEQVLVEKRFRFCEFYISTHGAPSPGNAVTAQVRARVSCSTDLRNRKDLGCNGRTSRMPLLCNSDDNLLEVVTRYYGRVIRPEDLRKAVAALELNCPPTESQDVELGDKQDEPMNVPPVVPTSTVETPSSTVTDEADWNPPPDIVKEVDVIIKELAHANVTQQVTQISRIVCEQPEDFIVWLVRVLMRRIPDMTNMLSTYYEFFAALCRREHGRKMERTMREEIYSHVKRLLNRQSCLVSRFNDRHALKNLGSWLGFMTIAKGRPIFENELNIKELLETALVKGNTALCVVVPFVTRIMLSCRLSVLCSPTSAWTRSIIRILVEIHRSHLVKLNIKFDVAVLMRAFGINIEEVETEECLDPARATLRRIEFTGFPERYDGDPMNSKLQLAQDLCVPLFVVEKTLKFYKFDVDVPEKIAGIDEEAVLLTNGQPAEILSIEVVNETLRGRRSRLLLLDGDGEDVQTADGPAAFDGYLGYPDTNEAPPYAMNFGDPMLLGLGEEQSIDYMHCAGMLFYELNQKYVSSSCAQIEAFESLLEIISTYKEQGLLAKESAEPFLAACMQVYFQLCYTLDEQGHFSRHHCHFYADSLATIISLTAEELVGISQETSGKFIGTMFNTIQKILLVDYESKGHVNFLTFPYSRLILSVMWCLLSVCLRLKNPDLLFMFQRDMASLMMHIQPANLPCFTFCWLNIIGNNKIVWSFVSNPSHQESSRTIYAHLLVTILKFLSQIVGPPGSETPACIELLQGIQRLICYLQLYPEVLRELHTLMQ